MFKVDKYHSLDAAELREVLRGSDIHYLLRLKRQSPTQTLEESFDSADAAYTFHRDGEVVAIMAFKGDNAWLQTSRLTDGHSKAVIRCGREALSLLPEKPMYCNVPKDDKRVLLLCKALGFTVQTQELPNYLNSGIDHITLWRTP